MGYKLVSKATDEPPLKLSSLEWEKLIALAATEAGPWKREEGRDYTRGSISSEDASRMADSVKEMLGPLTSRGRADEPTEEPAEETQRRPAGDFGTFTKGEVQNHLGHTEEDPLKFFNSTPHRRLMGERFVQLASKGAFEVIPESELEPGE